MLSYIVVRYLSPGAAVPLLSANERIFFGYVIRMNTKMVLAFPDRVVIARMFSRLPTRTY